MTLSPQATFCKTRIAAVIPAYNESHHIEAVVTEVRRRALAIVVDDGSIDDTATRARDAGAHVIAHLANRGYDKSLETGLRTAVDLGCDYAITIDADGQHPPNLLDIFIDEFALGADLIIGKRDKKQRWSEELFGLIGRRLWGVDDPLCGMKGYRLAVFAKIHKINSYKSIGTELMIRGIGVGVQIKQVEIKTKRRGGESRFGRGIWPNIMILNSLIFGIFISVFSIKRRIG